MRRAVPRVRQLATAMLVGAGLLAAWADGRAQSAAAPTPAQAGGEKVDRRSLIEAGDAPDLFLLYTGDVIGYVDPCG